MKLHSKLNSEFNLQKQSYQVIKLKHIQNPEQFKFTATIRATYQIQLKIIWKNLIRRQLKIIWKKTKQKKLFHTNLDQIN